MTKKIYLLLFAIGIAQVIYANPICQVHGGGVLDSMLLQFGRVANSWQQQINPIAKKIFFILFGMEFMWQLTVKKVFAGDIEKLWVFFFTRTILCFFFAKYLVNVKLYQDIIEYISSLGSRIGGFMLNVTPTHDFSTIGPSEIVGQFACVADAIHTISDSTGVMQYITLKLTLAFMQVVLFIVLIFIAYGLMKTVLQGYFLLYIGFLLTGFAGSSWTRDYWVRYVQAIASIAIKVLAVCVIMGVLTAEMQDWALSINQATSIDQLGAVIIKVLGSALFIALIANQLPEWAASTLAGSANMGNSNIVSSFVNSMSGRGLTNFTNGNVNQQLASKISNATATSVHMKPTDYRSTDNLSSAKFGSTQS